MFLKAFTRLFIAVILPFVILFFPLETPMFDRISIFLWQDRVDRTFQGTFTLLEEQLKQHPQQQWPAEFIPLSGLFSYELNLRQLAEFTGKPSTHQCLLDNQRYCIIEQDDVLAIYKIVTGSQWVIEMYADQSDQEDIRRNVSGTVALLNQQFPADDSSQWPAIVAQIQTKFGFPVYITHPDKLQLTKEEFNILQQTGTVVTNKEDDSILIYHQSSLNKPLLALGPIPMTESGAPIALLMLAVILGSISLGLLFFVFILCRDINILIQVASQFGKGHLSQRSKVKKSAVLAPLAQSFDAMADNIQNTITSQRDLTNAIAHDLRTPLSRLSFALEILDSEDLDAQDERRYIDSMSNAIDTLDHLIKQTLILARYTRASDISHFAHANLSSDLNQEVALFRIDYPKLTFSLAVDISLQSQRVFIDRRAISRALTNLVNNAARFAVLHISIVLATDQKNITLSVIDDGPGIPLADREQVLKPFAQLNNANRDKDSEHGLGLAIVAQIAKWHQGEIMIDDAATEPFNNECHTSLANKGAKISLIWPIHA